MTKLDLSKEYPSYFKSKKTPQIIQVEEANYLSISGVSAPEDPKFIGALDAIYPVAYTVKFMHKAQGQDFVMPKMEAFWWVESDVPFEETPRNQWYWEVMIRMPLFVPKEDLETAVIEVIQKKYVTRANEVYFKSIQPRVCAQILHIGSYEEEASTLEALYPFIKEQGYEINGYHNEIYLNDPRRTPQERLKTILRYGIIKMT